MYAYHRMLIDVAERIAGIDVDTAKSSGGVDSLCMTEFGDGKKHHSITGRTANGDMFELILEVSQCQESE